MGVGGISFLSRFFFGGVLYHFYSRLPHLSHFLGFSSRSDTFFVGLSDDVSPSASAGVPSQGSPHAPLLLLALQQHLVDEVDDGARRLLGVVLGKEVALRISKKTSNKLSLP